MNNHSQYHKIIITIFFIAFFSTILVLISICLNPITTYKLSFYSSIPSYVWYLLVISIILGVFTVFYQIANKKLKVTWFFISGIFLLLVDRLVVQWMPFISGYYTLSGDHLTQIGYLKDIIFSGHISLDNFYPITHILLSDIILITDLPLMTVANYSTALMSIFYIFSIYLVSRHISTNKKYQVIVLISAIVIIFDGYSLYLMPNGWSIFLIPLIFYLFFKDKQFKNNITKLTFLTIAITFPFFHPLSSLYLLIALAIVGITYLLTHYNIEKNKFILKNAARLFPSIEIAIISILFILWIFSYSMFNWNLRYLYAAITTGSDPSSFIKEVGIGISRLGLSNFDFVNFLVASMGHIFIVLFISALALLFFVKNKTYKKIENLPLFALFILSVFSFSLYFCSIFSLILGLRAVGGERLISYTCIFTPLFIGYWGIQFLAKNKYVQLKTIVLLLLLLSASIISIFALIPDPKTYSPSPLVTFNEVKSTEWVFSNMNENCYLSSMLSNQKRLAQLIFGVTISENYLSLIQPIPDHYGYDEFTFMGQWVQKDTLVVINPIDKITYATVWSPVERVNESDFSRMSGDSSANKIYSNGDSNVWFVQKT